MTLTTDRDYKEAYVGKIISDETARVVNQGRSIDKGELASILIGKSRVYDDGDFRQMAIKPIGEREVVLQTIEMNLPLWEEDKEYIKHNLNNSIR